MRPSGCHAWETAFRFAAAGGRVGRSGIEQQSMMRIASAARAAGAAHMAL
ncbi:hypothetical protein [Acetobacter sp. DsW_063]|nr:hypothetical protein [Acetobacter sp. DsW_063]